MLLFEIYTIWHTTFHTSKNTYNNLSSLLKEKQINTRMFFELNLINIKKYS